MKKIGFILCSITVLPLMINVANAVDINYADDVFMVAGIELEENNKKQAEYTSDNNVQKDVQQEESKYNGIKLTPTISSHKMIRMPEKDLMKMEAESENMSETINKIIVNHNTQVKQKKKEQLIEGYKIGRNGQESKYVHGEITEFKNGDIFGYLYDKKGSKTYIYGYTTADKDSISEFHVKDNETNEYILNSR